MNPVFGGPIRQNRVWFFRGFSGAWNKNYAADTYYPDGRQAFNISRRHAELRRLTSQLTARNKIRLSFDKSTSWNPRVLVGIGRGRKWHPAYRFR